MGRRKNSRPRSKEVRNLLYELPAPLRIVNDEGRVLYQNRVAEDDGFETIATCRPCSWQDSSATVELGGTPNPLQAELSNILEKQEHLRLTQQRTARKKRKAEAAQKELEKKLRQAESASNRLQQKIDSLTSELEELRKLPTDHKEAFREAEKTLKKLRKAEQKVIQLREQREVFNERLNRSQARVDELQEQLRELREARPEQTDQEAEVKDLRRQLEQAQEKEAALEQQLQSSQEESESRLRELESSQARVEELEAAHQSAQVRLDELETAQADVPTPLSEEVEQKVQELEQKLAVMIPAAHAMKLERQLQESREESRLASEELEVLKGLNQEQSESLALLRSEVEELREREQILKMRLEGLKAVREELEEIKASRSLAAGQNPDRLAELEQENRDLRGQLEAKLEKAPDDEKKTAVALQQNKTQMKWLEGRLAETERKYDAVAKELKEKQAALTEAREFQRLAFEDTLTGLPNLNILRRYLDFALEQAARYKRVVALLVLDLDHFRIVNESMGHQAGDQLLRAVAGRLKELVRSSDVLARRGEDEFVFLLSEIDGRQPAPVVTAMAKRILESLSFPFNVQGQRFNLTASIGVSLYPTDANSAEDLLMQADIAMFQAKEEGRGRICIYTGEFKRWRQHQTSLEGQLRHAVEAGEFYIVYQPIVQLAGRKMVGVEALLRWRHRQMGILGPESFLDTAERSGLLIQIGHQMIDQIAAQIVTWRQQRLNFYICLNLSQRQLLEPDLGTLISQVLARHGVDKKQLVIEVRETGQVRATDRWNDILSEFEQEGFTVCLDDFGFRDTRLTTLARPGVKMVKVEASMASALMPLARPVLKERAIAAIAKSVQDRFEHRALMKMGFDFAQGYAVAEPMEPFELGQKLLSR